MNSQRHAWFDNPLRIPARANDGELRGEVADRARRLIDATREAHAGWDPPPFEPEVYAQTLGIPIKAVHRNTEALGEWDAMLVPLGDAPHILLNGAVSNQRRVAFSIAHELAHLFFEGFAEKRYQMRKKPSRDDGTTTKERRLERLCNLGAAELLMPRPWFDEELERIGFRAAAVSALAERFGASLEAVALRMIDSNDEPCAIGFFEFDYPPTVRAAAGNGSVAGDVRVSYRARRVFRSRRFPFLFPEGKSVPDSSAVYRCSLTIGELGGCEVFRLGRTEEELRLTAFPLHREETVDEPPLVVGVFCRG